MVAQLYTRADIDRYVSLLTKEAVMADETAVTDDQLEADGAAAVEVENPTVVADELVWMRHGNGVAHEVRVGSEAHRRLLESGAVRIDGPTDDDTKVTDFAMVEKAKADKTSRR